MAVTVPESAAAEVLRERVAQVQGQPTPDDAALIQEPGAETQGGGPSPSGFGAVAAQIPATYEDWRNARAAEGQGLRDRESAMAPQIDETQRMMQLRQQFLAENPPPVAPTLAAPPPRGLTPFLAPVEGESPEASINKFLLAIGTFAGGISSLAQGNARGALASLTGALSGWQQGDAERADRAFKDWQAQTDTMLKQWDVERTAYKDWLEHGNLQLDQMMQGLQLTALKMGNRQAVLAFESGDHEKALEFLTTQQTAADKLAMDFAKIVEGRIIRDETERHNREMERLKAEATERKSAGTLPGMVTAELAAQRERGEPESVANALAEIERKGVYRAAAIGENAANVPQRTPDKARDSLEDIALARSQLTEMGRLASVVNLAETIGGIRPWLNAAIETGKIGPFPVSPDAFGKLSPDQQRFLALTQDYADTVLRMQSGAAITESEYQRMLRFLTDQSVTAPTFIARLGLQQDLMRVKDEIIRGGLSDGGYRAPKIDPPALAPTGAPSAQGQPAAKIRVRRKSDGQSGSIAPADFNADLYERVGG